MTITEHRMKAVRRVEECDGGPIEILCVDGNGFSINIRAHGKRADELGLRDVKPGDAVFVSVQGSILP
jgi:RecB family endonuclease NucS